MDKEIEEFDFKLSDLPETADFHTLLNASYLTISNFAVSTLTIMFKSSMKKINIQTLKEVDIKIEGLERAERTSMMNCCIYKTTYQVEGRKKPRKIAIKLFLNGGIHITGCVTVKQASIYANIILVILQQTFNQEVILESMKIQMINSNFLLSSPIDLSILGRYMTVPYQYNKAQHHALRAKTSEGVSVLVFMSGSVILTGSKTVEDTFRAFVYILDILETNFDTLRLSSYKRKR